MPAVPLDQIFCFGYPRTDAGFRHYCQELLHGPIDVGPLFLGARDQGISEILDV